MHALQGVALASLGDQHHCFSQMLAHDKSLTNFNALPKRFSIIPDHRGTQLVQPPPCRLVGTEAHDPLQFHGRDAIAACAYFKHCTEPSFERFARSGEHCPRRQAGLVTAFGAFQQYPAALTPDAFAMTSGKCRLTALSRLDPAGATALPPSQNARRSQSPSSKSSPKDLRTRHSCWRLLRGRHIANKFAGIKGIGMFQIPAIKSRYQYRISHLAAYSIACFFLDKSALCRPSKYFLRFPFMT